MVLARVLTAIKRETERGPLLWFVVEDSSRWAKGKEGVHDSEREEREEQLVHVLISDTSRLENDE